MQERKKVGRFDEEKFRSLTQKQPESYPFFAINIIFVPVAKVASCSIHCPKVQGESEIKRGRSQESSSSSDLSFSAGGEESFSLFFRNVC